MNSWLKTDSNAPSRLMLFGLVFELDGVALKK